MIALTMSGSFRFPPLTGDLQRSSQLEMDAAVKTLSDHKNEWFTLPVRQKIAVLDLLVKDLAAGAHRWVAAGLEAKGLAPDSTAAWEEWAGGPYIAMVNLCRLRESLVDIARSGKPRVPGPLTVRPDGQLVARVFPRRGYDRLFLGGVTAEVWMQPGVTAQSLPATQAVTFNGGTHAGRVALVLGAGNGSSIGASDILYRLFVRNQVVIYKVNPVNSYMGPLFEESFRALVTGGYLRIVYGGAEEGTYLCSDSDVDEVHITGSDKSFEAIVFGAGPNGAARKAKNQPLMNKPVTAELGNVSPVIVVPGPWSESDLAYQGEHIASLLVANAGFNCLTPRVLIQHMGWDRREELLRRVRLILRATPARKAYYPGARQRFEAFLSAHPDAETFGAASNGDLPWALIPYLDPNEQDDICFTTEAFCGLFSETALRADGVADYISRAVAFANDHLWGTLNATLLVHPESLKDRAVAAAVDRAVADLRYGCVTVNQGAGSAYGLCVVPWGGFPAGASLRDIQSGIGFVHNTLMFERAQKCVVRGPFRAKRTPPWFPTRSRRAAELFAKLVGFEASPSPWKVPGILRRAM